MDEYAKNQLKQALVQYDRTLLVADNRRCEPKKFGGESRCGNLMERLGKGLMVCRTGCESEIPEVISLESCGLVCVFRGKGWRLVAVKWKLETDFVAHNVDMSRTNESLDFFKWTGISINRAALHDIRSSCKHRSLCKCQTSMKLFASDHSISILAWQACRR